MTLHTETYCATLDRLDRVQAVRAIHQAYLQLAATAPAAAVESFDNLPAIQALVACLKDAGHMGFNPAAGRVA